jgi:uncharacterized Ntn-hydrolase superfamily protein
LTFSTFSIVACSEDSKCLGVAVASKFLAVGAYVPACDCAGGAIATQAYANLGFRSEGLALLRAGRSAKETLEALLASDDQREERQVGIVGADGESTTFTGARCNPWAGGTAGPGYAIQGNILSGPGVVESMEAEWRGSARDPDFSRRLVYALAAGDAAGGDRRGRQSAALLVVSPGAGYGGTSDVLADLRVDDHPDPVPELLRLLDLHRLYFGTPNRDELIALEEPLVSEVAGLLSLVGYPPRGTSPDGVRDALWQWASVENLEERVVDGPLLDPLVLEELRKHAKRAKPPMRQTSTRRRSAASP